MLNGIGLVVTNFFLFFLLPLVLVAILIKLINWYVYKTQAFPLNDVSRQAAGAEVRSLLKSKIQWLWVLVCTLPILPVLLYVNIIMSHLDKEIEIRWLVYGLILVFLVHSYFVVRFLFQVGRLKLLEHAETVVGEELNKLMHSDFYVYHDVKVNQVTIHHLLLSTKGVFAVTVVSQPKRFSRKDQQFRMKFENQSLIFPNGKNKKIVQEAQKQANYAAAWLKKLGGNAVKVRPILVIPGWYLELKDRPPFPIITTKQINTFFSRATKNQIDEYTYQKIIDAIEQKPS